MSFLLIDNTKNLLDAEMTPKLIKYFRNRSISLVVISEPEELYNIELSTIVGIILSGGPILLSEKSDIFFYSKNFTALIEFHNTPILGICFGFQLMGVAYGGLVTSLGKNSKHKITETIYVDPETDSILFKELPPTITVYQCHNDYLQRPPRTFTVLARNSGGTIEAIESSDKLRFGVQFHPENSTHGHKILDNFSDWCLDRSTPSYPFLRSLASTCHT